MKRAVIYLFVFQCLKLASQSLDATHSDNPFFRENKGQVCDQNAIPRPDILFSGSDGNLIWHLKSCGISYQILKPKEILKDDSKETSKEAIVSGNTIYRVDVDWVNCNKNAEVVRGNELVGYENFYLRHCPKGATMVKNYESVTYKNIYNGIDLKWYGKNGALEYDFIVTPGGNPDFIQLNFKGTETIFTNDNGDLIVQTPLGKLIENKPVAFQNGNRVDAIWVVKGKTITIKLGKYDKTKTLVIDPAIRQWGTYYGGNSSEFVYGNTTNNLDESYIVGETQSVLNIATSGAYQTTISGGSDIFMAKFNSAGVRQWGTYIGGSGGNEKANSVTTDPTNGMVYLVGQASLGFPVTGGAHQVNNGGAGTIDGVVCKFNSAGVLQWSTYYGGSGTDEIKSCCIDNAGNLIFSGVTTSTATTTEIATLGSHQSIHGLGGSFQDAFLVKFSSAGLRMWGTYYGGAGDENGYACAADISGNLYMCGSTSTPSGTSIATAGAQQLSLDGVQDAFLVKFNSAGIRQWGTFYGASGVDRAQTCSTFSNNTVYIGGIASAGSVGIVSTIGAHQTVSGGGADGFLVKFNDLGSRQWGTYFGGSGAVDIVNGSCVSNSGDIFICGRTNSSNNISTNGSYQFTFGGGADDAFLAKFNSLGINQWGTYYGGALSDQGNSCSTNSLSNIYISGTSSSTSNIASAGAHQTVYGGFSNDGFHSKIKDCSNSLTLSIAGTNTLCTGQSATLSATGLGFTTYTWSSGPNTSSISVTPTSSTTYTLVAGTATVGCNYSAQHTISVNIQPTVNVVVTPTSALVCSGNSATLIATGASTYSWSTGAITNSIVVTPTALAQPIVTGYNGTCSHSLMTNVGVSPTPTINITGAPTATFCSGNTFSITASGASTYTWSNGPTTPSNVVSPTVLTIYTVTGSLGPCNSTKTISVNMITTPTVNVSSSANAICAGGNATLTANGASTFSWNTSATNSVIVVSPTVNTTYTVTGYNGACINTKTIAVTMTTNIAMTASANPNVLCSMSQLTLTSTGATNYTWSTAALTNTDVVSPISSDTYTVYGTSGSCTGSAVVNVTVNPLPNLTVSASNSLICLSGTVTLTAVGAQNYTWMPGNSVGATQTNTPNSTTIYTVTGTDALLCSNTQTIQVTVDPCTGVKEYRNESVEVYPNPNNGSFTINGSKMGHYFIINSIGQIVSEFFIDEQKQNINISNLPSGIYQIKGNDISKKIIVLK